MDRKELCIKFCVELCSSSYAHVRIRELAKEAMNELAHEVFYVVESEI